LEAYRSSGGLAKLEEDWLAAVETAPQDPEPFVDLALELAKSGEETRARSLLELYDAELVRRGLWMARLKLLKATGSLTVRFPKLQKTLLETLEKAYPHRSDLPQLLAHAGLDRTLDTPQKLWESLARLDCLLSFHPGMIVEVNSQGMGWIRGVNLALNSLKIELTNGKTLSVGFRAAAKLVRVLPPENFFRLQLEAPERLKELAKDAEPAELLRLLLESAGRPLTAAEIRDALGELVPQKAWNRWWTEARKHPNVVVSTEGRQTLRWESSPEAARRAMLAQLERASPREKLRKLRQLAERFPDLAATVAGELASLAGEIAAADPGLSFEIWFALERVGALPKPVEELLDEVFGPSSEPMALLSGIEDRLLRERALLMLRERRADWLEIWKRWFTRETDPKVLDTLATGLRAADPSLWLRLAEDILAAPHRASAQLVWLAERAANDLELLERSPLRLLQQILLALGNEDFTFAHSRLRALFNSGGTVPKLLAVLDADQAESARDAIQKCGALADYERTPLLNTLSLRFRSLEAQTGPETIRALPSSIASRREELRKLLEEEIPRNRQAIAEARALGDLRENFEYKAARQRHEYLNARASELARDLSRAAPIEIPQPPIAAIALGAEAVLMAQDPSIPNRTFVILGPWESDPAQGILSYESDLAKLLLGKRVGDEVEYEGHRYRVASIEPWRALAAETAAGAGSPK
jgi:transcription elongation GreA/GreB family factor